MADKHEHELLILPNRNDSLIVPSGIRSSLAARGRGDASSLLARRRGPAYLARVRVEGKWGLIDRCGRYIADPIYHDLCEFNEGLAAFGDSDGYGQFYGTLLKKQGKHWNGWLFTIQLSGRYLDIPDAGSWGFLNSSGKSITKTRFEFARGFSEGLAGVRSKGKWGFIQKDGTFVIEPRFEGVRDFRGGLSVVMINGKCGFIDKKGNFVVEPQYYYLREFSEGLACASSIPGEYGYIDRSGSYAIEPGFTEAGDFHSGIAQIEDMDGYRGYINMNGRSIYQLKKQSEYRPYPCSPVDGVAFVVAERKVYAYMCGHKGHSCHGNCNDVPCSCDKYHRLCTECSLCTHKFCDSKYAVFLDLTGRSILGNRNHLLDPVDPFSEGLGLVRLTIPGNTEDDFMRLYGFVDAGGRMIIRPQFLEAYSFNSGRALVKDKDVGWALIDITGNIVNRVDFGADDPSPRYYGLDFSYSQRPLDLSDLQSPSRFSEGYARIRVDEKFGFMDINGRIAIEPQFHAAADFANGLARVERVEDVENGFERLGYIDTSGKIVIPCQFSRAADFDAVTT